MKKYVKVFIGFLIGIINTLLGAGGGMLAVPALKKSGLSQQEAHASAIAVIFPITIISATIYIIKGYTDIKGSIPYMIAGIFGGILGSFLLPKVPEKALRKIFAIFMIWAGTRLMLR